ncbi:MAG: Fur family transcriptional regulator [Gemmataceae bacterium]
MNDIEHATPSAVATDLRDALDKAGWRFTKQRAAVFDYLQSVDTHPTAEDVYLAVRQDIPNISLATVYKALDALVDSGLAAKIANSDGPSRYDCRCDNHYHLRDLKTGQVRDLHTPFDSDLIAKLDPELVESLRQQGFEVTSYRLELLGHFTSADKS